ncbi:MAG TPA: hypothetical protein VGN63_18680 [Flavisolibacter sp.]|jgi:hypothetical protein|nr:hypothetical protein [Flavisolibacter sp.]
MYLKLAIAGDVIASVQLNAQEVGNLEYIYTKRSLLTEACSETIHAKNEFPVYYIEVASKMNRKVRK